MSSRILLVEDAPDVQLIVTDLLRGHGHEVAVSGDGDEALRVATEQPFDLLILDVMLPGKVLDILWCLREATTDPLNPSPALCYARASVRETNHISTKDDRQGLGKRWQWCTAPKPPSLTIV